VFARPAGFARKHLDVNARSEINLACPDSVISQKSASYPVGAVVGGFLFSIFGATGITGFNIYSLIVAIIGSVVVLWLYHQLAGRRRI
jgi:hypothetical protein